MGVGVVGLLRSGGAEKLWGKTGSKTGQKTVGRSIRGTVGSSREESTRLWPAVDS